MDIWRYALAQLRGGWRRTLASALAVLTAVTSFVLLTGSATTERLVVTDTLNRNRGAYDILVRAAVAFLDDQRAQSHSRGTCGLPCWA